MELKDAVKGRRSIRKFKDMAVSKDKIEAIISDALWAPSPMNRQNWKIFVLTGKRKNELISLCSKSYGFIRPRLEKLFKPSVVEWTKKFFEDFGGAPLVLVIYYIPSGEESTGDLQGTAALIQNLLLLLHAEGLAGCWMTGPLHVSDDINSYLGVDGMELVAVIPAGYPDQTPPVPPRRVGNVEYLGFDE